MDGTPAPLLVEEGAGCAVLAFFLGCDWGCDGPPLLPGLGDSGTGALILGRL